MTKDNIGSLFDLKHTLQEWRGKLVVRCDEHFCDLEGLSEYEILKRMRTYNNLGGIEFRKLCPLCHLYQDLQNPTCYKCDMKLNNSTIIKREYDEHGSLIKTGLVF